MQGLAYDGQTRNRDDGRPAVADVVADREPVGGPRSAGAARAEVAPKHEAERRLTASNRWWTTLRERESLVAALREPRSFSHRQADLLVLIAAGFSNREISERLRGAPKSMVRRIRELKMELNARTRADLIEIAEQRGLLSLREPCLIPRGRPSVGVESVESG